MSKSVSRQQLFRMNSFSGSVSGMDKIQSVLKVKAALDLLEEGELISPDLTPEKAKAALDENEIEEIADGE